MTTQQQKPNKTFDCLAYKRRVQAQIYEEIKNLSPTEEIAYFRKRAEEGELGLWWRKIKQQTTKARV